MNLLRKGLIILSLLLIVINASAQSVGLVMSGGGAKGIAHIGLFTDMTEDEWDRLFAVNVRSAFSVTKAVLPGMISRQNGAIVSVSSMWGEVGASCEVAYSATKAALIGLTKALAKEVTDKGILVNAVSPGSVSSSSKPDIDHVSPSELSFLGRTGSDRENANLILFLASDDASYIAGQNIQIDGCRKKM